VAKAPPAGVPQIILVSLLWTLFSGGVRYLYAAAPGLSPFLLGFIDFLMATLFFGAANLALSNIPSAPASIAAAEPNANQVLDRGFVRQVIEKVSPSVCVVTPVGVRNRPARGTGFVVRSGQDLLVLTAAHVAQPGWRISVSFGEESMPATLVARDPSVDLALLKVEGLETKTPLSFRDGPALGEFAVAIGYPGVTKGMATSFGIIASVSDDWVVADATVSPGMSGGPLVDADGMVIGVATQLVFSFGSKSVPASKVLELIEYGETIRRRSSETGEKPQSFQIILFDDPFNTRKRVEEALVGVGLNQDDASNSMQSAHEKGRGIVKTFGADQFDDANDFCLRLRGQDLLVEVIPVDADGQATTISFDRVK